VILVAIFIHWAGFRTVAVRKPTQSGQICE